MQLQSRIGTTSVFKEIVIAFLLVLSIFVLHRVGWSDLALNSLQSVTTPMSGFFAQTLFFIEQPLYAVSNLFNSSAELSILKVQYAQSMADLSEMDRLMAENQQLRAMIENRHLAFAERIITSPIVSYAYPAVAAGETQGAHEGALVVVADTMIGRVAEVQSTQSRIELLSSVDAEPVLAVTESGQQGLLEGNGKGVVLTQLPPDAEVKIGERLVSVGQAGVKPGVFLGIVAGEHEAPSAPTKTLPIDQLVSFYTTGLVELQ